MKKPAILDVLKDVQRAGNGWTASCPATDDQNPSFSLTVKDDRPLYHCFAGCSQEEIRQALEKLGVKPRDLGLLSKQRRPGGGTGCTLKGYATVKRLKRKFLKKLGVGEISYL